MKTGRRTVPFFLKVRLAVSCCQKPLYGLVHLDDEESAESHRQNEYPVLRPQGRRIEQVMEPGRVSVYQLENGQYAHGNVYGRVSAKNPSGQRRAPEETAVQQVSHLPDDDGTGNDGTCHFDALPAPEFKIEQQ